MSVLQYASEVRRPSVVSDELVETKPSEEELELTRQLVQALTREDLDLAEYRDEYTDKLREIIEAKVAGQEVVSPPAEAEQPQVVNLMEALKASVQRIEKPEKKMAASGPSRAKATPRKRKSG